MADDKKSKEVIEEVKSTKEESTLYYFYSTGCAFCKKVEPVVNKLNSTGYDILKLDLSDKDNQGLKNELQKEYNEWYKKNDKLPNIKTADEVLSLPRPKTEIPTPPNMNSTDEELSKWQKGYDKWSKENEHLPNIIPGDTIVARFKQRRDGAQNTPPQAPIGAPTNLNPDQEARLQAVETNVTNLESKIDKIINHFGVK